MPLTLYFLIACSWQMSWNQISLCVLHDSLCTLFNDFFVSWGKVTFCTILCVQGFAVHFSCVHIIGSDSCLAFTIQGYLLYVHYIMCLRVNPAFFLYTQHRLKLLLSIQMTRLSSLCTMFCVSSVNLALFLHARLGIKFLFLVHTCFWENWNKIQAEDSSYI